MTQNERILKYLKDNGSITSAEAMYNLGIYRLSSRINDLKKLGIKFNKTMESHESQYGVVHYARWSLDENDKR